MKSKQEAGKTALNIRATEDVIERLERLVSKYPITKHALARIALERGLDAIESDPKWFEKAGKK